MSEHIVELLANEGVFVGLAKQNLLFHQCLCELIDNAIAAVEKDAYRGSYKKFQVDVIFIRPHEKDYEFIDLYIVDNCKGMGLETLKDALQLGKPPTTDNRLNEHGFGLKNALATLSGGNNWWKLWTKSPSENKIYSVEGPFRPEMLIQDDDTFPEEPFIPTDSSTIIKVCVRLSFIQTVQGRGAPSKDLSRLRDWLIEHLGVLYRGYLEQDKDTYDSSGVIRVSIDNNTVSVPPVPVPIGNMTTEYIHVELGGQTYKLQYQFGTLDEVRRDELVKREKAKYYYQKNMPTQGIDIRLGKRVIATHQFETIWKTESGGEVTRLSRDPHYNDFVGELLIPDLPRGVLTTVNNKTDFNLDDPGWQRIFDELNKHRPTKEIRNRSESVLKDRWRKRIISTNPEDEVSKEINVWGTGTRIDIYRKTADGKIIIYELKVGSAHPLHLYQLKMYWDGLVLNGEQPREAVLLVEDFNTALESMANKMNEVLIPPAGSNPYNFKVEKLKDKEL